ncbi:hypothetical protein BLA60_39485 [Actinophytocola xinjiangensis]|uniref:Uncharacterized protein n=2 Tax=Actinophytocola xinjiangensis TaxID=485602 RepID=A0A7Z0WEA2_9PSEU|nr:hypothetical protein BLA60_39485 [Actinophytocola xinjiangensis]
MREVLDEVPMGDRDRQIVASAIGEIEAHWQTQHRERYDQAVATRDEQHQQVMSSAQEFRSRVDDVADAVRSGRMPAAEARAWVRDAMGELKRYAEQHDGITQADEHLTAFEALTPEAYQEQLYARMPTLEQAAPTLAAKVDEYLTAHPRGTRGPQPEGPMALNRHPGRR